MALKTIKLFLASSQELKDDREAFRNFIGVENDRLHKQGIYVELLQWENFLDAVSDTRLQNEYNKALRGCDLALCLFFTKVGKYTAEEFDTAYQVFKNTGRPLIWTYFKDAPVNAGSIDETILTLLAFKKKLDGLGHFHTVYGNMDNLKYQFRNQLDKVLPQLIGSGAPQPETLPDAHTESSGQPQVKITFNEALTRRLMEAMQAHSPRAKKFLENASRMSPDWQTQSRFADPAKELIAFSYAGILGIQLRKLMAIGKEDTSSVKFKKYAAACRLTGKRALQLLCFTLLSKLWDEKREAAVVLLPEQEAVIRNFFEDEFEWDIEGFLHLLQTLVAVFSEARLPFPLPEFEILQPQLQPQTAFVSACSKLAATNVGSEETTVNAADVLAAEESLTAVLEALNFLVNYQMVSIRNIGYYETRNTKPYFLYHYTALGVDSKSNINQERFTYAESPTTTDAVLLYKGTYNQGVNLYPFVIDVNALAFEGGARICFYACRNYADDSLQYQFLEDNSTVSIGNGQTLRPGTDINEVLMNAESRKRIRFDAVFTIFGEAKKAMAESGAITEGP